MFTNRILPSFCLLFLVLFVPDVNSQTRWEKYPNNPVIEASQFQGISGTFDYSYAFNSYTIEGDGVFRMWYVGFNNSFSIGDALSMDGIRWYSNRDNPVLVPGPPGTFDATGVRKPCVVRDGEGYKMYYFTGTGYNLKIGLAISSNGHNWTKYVGNPVLDVGPSGSWDAVGVWAPMVIYENQVYKMWYQGYDGAFASIGLATSADGIHWTKHAGNPVLSHGSNVGDFDYLTAGEPNVVHAFGSYHMFYTSTSSVIRNNIGYAYSRNGINWIKYRRNPVVEAGSSTWENINVSSPSVLVKDRKFHMWYSAYGSSGAWQIGYATSEAIRPSETPIEGPDVDRLEVKGNYPNPFNPETVIHIEIPESGRLRVLIYDILGREVKVLTDEVMPSGSNDITWDGTNSSGQHISSGTYFYRAELFSKSGLRHTGLHKMILAK